MSTPIPTARRNLAFRIEGLLRGKDRNEVPNLTAWQADLVLAAIEALDEGRFVEGEDIMMKAERPDLWERPGHAPGERKDVAQLLEALKRAVAE